MSIIKKVNRKLTGKVRYKIGTRIGHVGYDYHYENQVISLTVSDIRLSDPKLECSHGAINYQREKRLNKYTFNFKLEDLPHIDGISSSIFITNNGKKYNFSTFVDNKKLNYATTYEIMYTDDFVYYLRNTASRAGRLLVQKKPRAHFECTEYEQRVNQIYEQTKNMPMTNIILYEKYGSKFEESASKLFEKIAHIPNVYYVLDHNSEQYPEIKVKYQDKILSPDEDKFIEVLFTAKYFIGTEVPFHMVTLRTPYTRYRTEITKTDKHKFIFLQHGVMYALSMRPASRNSFKKNGVHAPYKVVISSELEADHFMDLGRYQRSDLWKTGLATFDNKKINSDADKITIMLTWRPWDEQKDSFEETTYYQAVKSIVDSIEHKEKLQLMLHPKVLETINADNELLKYKFDGLINDGLNQTKVLISDYSSVTFDAFYRGVNVIFWWRDKNFCLEQYKNHLMLNEDNIFGDIVYDNNDLNQVIVDNYKRQQKKEHIGNFRKIVEFNDNHNTDRIVEYLYNEDGLDLDFGNTANVISAIDKQQPVAPYLGQLRLAYLNQLEHYKLVEYQFSEKSIEQLIYNVANTPDHSIKQQLINDFSQQ